MSVCRRYARDPSSAKDILQESMIKIFKNIHKYKPSGSFVGWMRRICVNTALQSFDKACFKNEILGLDDLTEQPFSIPVVYSHLGEEELLEVISNLPEGFKQVFNLYVIEGLSHREVGQALGITESTSRSQLTRARNYLRQQLQKRERFYEVRAGYKKIV